ncbi:hypothetical protein CIPAW_03G205300 [Carya illinoinensis]|uniref:G protein gamma domain-containing protein n=1 Tax=Carya illinoinensis TaxID=32201 RepID=A0A8T1R583_CARIL|nr:hypothetical protein CIPAW_03G205300 [Carya illinoinensis]
MAAPSGYSSSAPPLPPPRPKSPPQYPDLYGKRREMAKVQMLEREIGFLEEELKSVQSLQPASRCCKEVADYVVANSDPFIATNRKNRRRCRFWKWLCRMPCFNLSWICCCCCYNGCSLHLKMPRCCCDCNPCNSCSCASCCCCNCNRCNCGSCLHCGSCNRNTCNCGSCVPCASCDCNTSVICRSGGVVLFHDQIAVRKIHASEIVAIFHLLHAQIALAAFGDVHVLNVQSIFPAFPFRSIVLFFKFIVNG